MKILDQVLSNVFFLLDEDHLNSRKVLGGFLLKRDNPTPHAIESTHEKGAYRNLSWVRGLERGQYCLILILYFSHQILLKALADAYRLSLTLGIGKSHITM